MNRSAVTLFVLLGLTHSPGQGIPETDLDPSLIALGKIRHRMAQSLREVQNYTCAETVRRIRVEPPRKRRKRKAGRAEGEPSFSDTVRLEVAVVDGKELYSWPGAEFQPVPLSEIVGFGLTATGSFSAFAESLFVESHGRVRFAGEEDRGGRRTLRYDYGVSLFRSGYTLGTEHGSARVPYQGSIWADPETFEVIAMTVRVPDPPARGSAAVGGGRDPISIGGDRRRYVNPCAVVDVRNAPYRRRLQPQRDGVRELQGVRGDHRALVRCGAAASRRGGFSRRADAIRCSGGSRAPRRIGDSDRFRDVAGRRCGRGAARSRHSAWGRDARAKRERDCWGGYAGSIA